MSGGHLPLPELGQRPELCCAQSAATSKPCSSGGCGTAGRELDAVGLVGGGIRRSVPFVFRGDGRRVSTVCVGIQKHSNSLCRFLAYGSFPPPRLSCSSRSPQPGAVAGYGRDLAAVDLWLSEGLSAEGMRSRTDIMPWRAGRCMDDNRLLIQEPRRAVVRWTTIEFLINRGSILLRTLCIRVHS